MCDCPNPAKRAWRGWLPLPPQSGESGIGPWIDLTHRLTEDLSRSPAFPRPTIRQIIAMPKDPANVTEIQMVCHHGTHVDAPRHFMLDGPSFDQIPLDRLYGPAVVWRIEKGPFAVITPEDFEEAHPKVRAGDMVLLDTGWAQHVNSDIYEDHASLSPEAAEWLVDHQVKLLGIDCSTPDLTSHKRPASFTWPVHQILLSQGVLIAEHLTNLRALANSRVEAMFLALPVAGSDGGLSRAVARPMTG
ncbi:cyclase family protein [Pseudorhodoplanes sp.]|uniref:cyclase family protein n=1 Tax=Pseudorhodoplanes sp. TaxID=1934341 RepID=UPI002CE89AC3|nr:cyclase family protein [Pseudorhodoplanes sp.]HWV53308.1 cyclase family protein [Pseudorhodoplanes sp.]